MRYYISLTRGPAAEHPTRPELMPGGATRRRATGASTVGEHEDVAIAPHVHRRDGGLRDEAAHVRQRHRAVPVDGGGERAGLAHRVGIAVGGGRQGKGRLPNCLLPSAVAAPARVVQLAGPAGTPAKPGGCTLPPA